MPNTKVKVSSALTAGIVAGVSYQLFLWAYLEFQFGVTRYNAIYGSFALFPLFIVFLQVSWIIVLIGGEISYSLQDIHLHVDDRQHFVPNYQQKITLAITTMALCAKRFQEGGEAYTAQALSKRMDMPYKVMKEFCNELCKAGLLSELTAQKGKDEHSYQPATAIGNIDIAYVITKLDELSDSDKPLVLPEELRASVHLVKKRYQQDKKAIWNKHVLDVYPEIEDDLEEQNAV
jgi:membrane protein